MYAPPRVGSGQCCESYGGILCGVLTAEVGVSQIVAMIVTAAVVSLVQAAPVQIPPAGQQKELQSKADCPAASMIAFDRQNRPYLVDTRDPKRYGLVAMLREGRWVEKSFLPALKEAGFNLVPDWENPRDLGTMTFDSEDSLYILIPTPRKRAAGGVEIDGDAVLIYTKDYGETFKVYRLDSRPYLCTMETRNGGSSLDYPPALVLGKPLKYVRDVMVNVRGRKQRLRFCEFDRLSVVFPVKSGDGLTLPEPVEVTEKANGITSHSGALNVGVTRKDKFYVVYIEVPENLEAGKNPVWISEIDRISGKVLNRKRLLDSDPVEADSHSTPALVVDSKGMLHIVTGSHAWTPEMQGFYYVHSIGDGIDKWSEPVTLGKMQTYVGLAVDEKDNLHLAYRHTPDLSYRRRDSVAGVWEEQTVIVQPPCRGKYSCYYHHVYVDRRGRIYVEFTYVDQSPQEKEYPHLLAVSADGGRSWQLATTALLSGGQEGGVGQGEAASGTRQLQQAGGDGGK